MPLRETFPRPPAKPAGRLARFAVATLNYIKGNS